MAASFCLDCKEKACLKTGKPCKEVEDILRRETTGRRNWQTVVDPFVMERVSYRRKSEGGKRREPIIYGDDLVL